jgi:hypothetical protein
MSYPHRQKSRHRTRNRRLVADRRLQGSEMKSVQSVDTFASIALQAHGSGGSWWCTSLPARTAIRAGGWSATGPQACRRRTISLGTGLSCLADHSICSSETICVARECPLQTISDRPTGHATGTSGLVHSHATARFRPVPRRCGPDLLPGGRAWPGRPAPRAGPAPGAGRVRGSGPWKPGSRRRCPALLAGQPG